MSSEECFAILKITVLVLILLVLVMNSSEGFTMASAKDDKMSMDLAGMGGSSSAYKQRFAGEGPVYYPMADEQYLNKYLFGMDPAAMSPAAVAGVQAPIFQRLNQSGTSAYAGLGDKGVHQLTNDLLVAKNLGAGQCASGSWVGDTTACPEALVGLAPGAEAFDGYRPNPYA